MKKQRLLQRFLSAILVLLMIIGAIFTDAPANVQASSPIEIHTNYGFYFPGIDLIALNNVDAAIQAKDGVTYTGTAKIDGEEKTVSWTESGNNLILAGYKQTTVNSIELVAGTRLTSADGSTIIILNYGRAYTKTGTGTGAGNWTETVTLSASYKTVYEAAGQIGFSVTSTGGSFVNNDYVLGGGKRGWYDCKVAVDGVDTSIQVFIGSDAANGLTELFFGTDNLKRAIQNGATITFPATMELKKSGYVIALDFGTEQNVTKTESGWTVGTVPTELSTEVTFYRCNENLTAYTFSNVEIKDIADNTVFSGTLRVGGEELTVNWIKSGNCFVIQYLKDNGVFTKLEVAAGTKLTSSDGTIIITITNQQAHEKKDGSWVPYVPVTELSTEVTFYRCNENLTAYAFSNTNIKDIADNTIFSGTLTIDGEEKAINWIKSGSCFVIQYLKDDGTFTKLEVAAGTELTSSDGTIHIIITNQLVYEKKDGSWVPYVPVTELSTEVTFYRCNENLTAYAFSNTNIKDIADNTVFSGMLTIDGEEKAINWIKSGSCFVIQYLKDDGTFTKLEVAAGTKLTSSDGTKIITITNNVKYIKSGDMWVEDIPVTELETKVSLYKCNETMIAYSFSNAEIKHIADGTIFSGKLIIDKVETAVNWIKSGNCFVLQGLTDDGSFMRQEVAAGTKLYGSNATNITITNGLKFVKLEGSWMEDYGQTKIEYNDIKISFRSFDGRGFYLKAEIVAGPDKGKTIGTEAYGTWASRSEGVLYCNGTEEMTVNYSPNVDMLYISGNYDLKTLTTLLFKKGTVLIPYSGAQNRTYMRLVNTLELEKEPVYGRWGVKGVIKTPTIFNDLTVSVYNVTGQKVVLEPVSMSRSSKKVADVYGNGTLCYGSVIYKHPVKGTYTNENATFYVSGNQILLMDSQIGMMDSIEMKAGTILWPSADSNSQVPIRIQNSLLLTRDAEDEWIFDAGSGVAASVTSPATGDNAQFMYYIGVMFIALLSVCGVVCYNKKRRRVGK